MKLRFTLSLQTDDMGTFTQPGCTSFDDALWHVNRARAHDGLPPMSRSTLEMLTMSGGSNRAAFTSEN